MSNDGPTPAPAAITDRPLPLIDVVDGAFAALRQRPRTLVSVVAGFVVPAALLEGYLVRNALGGVGFTEILNDPALAEEAANQPVFGSELIVGFLLDWFVLAVSGVAVSRVVAGWLGGDDIGALDALRFTARRGPVIAAVFVLNHLAQIVGLVLLIVPGLIALVLFSLASPVMAVENVGPIQALRRSSELVRRRKGSAVGAVVMTGAVAYGVDYAVNLLPTVVALFIGTDQAWPLVSAAAMLSALILVPFTSATMCLVYLDIRFRTEGLDLQMRAVTIGARSGRA